MIAILHPAFPELAMQLLAGLEEESDRLMVLLFTQLFLLTLPPAM